MVVLPPPAIYALRPGGSVDDRANIPHITGVRRRPGKPDAWDDILRLDWLDTDGHRYAMVTCDGATTDPGTEHGTYRSWGTWCPGWYPDVWAPGYIHESDNVYRRRALVQLGPALYWPVDNRDAVGTETAAVRSGAATGGDLHPSYGGDRVGLNSLLCQVGRTWKVYRDGVEVGTCDTAHVVDTVAVLLGRLGRACVGYALIEAQDGDAALRIAA